MSQGLTVLGRRRGPYGPDGPSFCELKPTASVFHRRARAMTGEDPRSGPFGPPVPAVGWESVAQKCDSQTCTDGIGRHVREAFVDQAKKQAVAYTLR